MVEMRKSRVLAKLRAGDVVNCFKLNFADARIAELAALNGFDCLWTDVEHVGNDLSVIEKQIWAAKTADTDVVVRVSRGSYSDYIRPLELDATGIMVPHVMSCADARQIAQWTRFHPVGRRPLDGGNADGVYCRLATAEYVAQANRERFVIIQIEDPEPLEELDAIAEVDGIDMLFFGPGDFSHRLGVAGELNHPDVCAARKQVAEVARAHGKFAGTVGSPANARELIDLGYQFINLGSDVSLLANSVASVMEQFAHCCQAMA